MKQPQRSNVAKEIDKLKEDDKYLSYHILKAILQETDVPTKVIEEPNCELFYETLSGKGKIIFSNGMKYYGPVKNGLLETSTNDEKKNDKCIIVFSDGTKYEGEIHENKISGEGKYYFPTGAKYHGHLLNGLRDGFGKYFSPEGVIYEGEWKKGLKNGKGLMKRDNMTYEGDWKNGCIDGSGKIKWENGNIYNGEFKENHISGYGFMIWYNLLEKYFGKWKNDKQNGNGIHIWFEPQGELKEMRNRYVGEWENGERNGYGIFFYSNGGKYEGEWLHNLKHGFGIMIYEDGRKYIGRFEEDRLLDENNQLDFITVNKLYDEYIIKKAKEKEKEKERGKVSKGSSKKSISGIISPKVKYSKGTIKNKNGPIKATGNLLNINSKENNNDANFSNFSKAALVNNNDIHDKSNSKDIQITEESKKNYLRKNTLPKKKNYKYNPIFDISDIVINYPEIENDIDEITKVLLRNLTVINKLYNYINKIARTEVKTEDNQNMILRDDEMKRTGQRKKTIRRSRLGSSSKSLPKKTIRKEKQGGLILNTNADQTPRIEEKIRSDDICFCINLKDFWYFLKDCGIFNNYLSVSEFDRLFNQGENNDYISFQIPENITDSNDIYSYIDKMIHESKKNFVYKYNIYIDYYYRDKEIPNSFKNILNETNSTQNNNKKIELASSIHDNTRVVLPRLFYECLIRLSFLYFTKSENEEERKMKLSKKLQNLLDIIVPPKMKKKNNSFRNSKIEQSFNGSIGVIENKQKVIEYKYINEFCTLFFNELKELFELVLKVAQSDGIKMNKKDKTITYIYLYRRIICASEFLRKLVPNISDYVEIISNYYKVKINFIENLKLLDKQRYYDTINKLLSQEMIEYEFTEIIFLICRKYLNDNNKRNTDKEFSNILTLIKEELVKIKKNTGLRKKYYFPKLKSHEMKEQLIIEEKKRLIEENKRRLERQRYLKEREILEKEDNNVFIDDEEGEEEDDDDDEDGF